MDDRKISHKDSTVIDENIASLKSEYGKVGEMTVRRGKKHDYLGMTLDFSKDGAFIVDMEEYLKEIIKDLPEDMNGTATTPAADHLFKVRECSQTEQGTSRIFPLCGGTTIVCCTPRSTRPPNSGFLFD